MRHVPLPGGFRPQAAPLVVTVAVAAGVLAAITALAWTFQRRLIYFPSDEPPTAVARTLTGWRDVSLSAADGLWLGAYYSPPATEKPGPAAIVFNGNAGHRGYRVPLGAALAERGCGVLLFDYRGYGGNPRDPSEAGLLLDARAAHAYLVSQPEVDPDRVVCSGESLGTGVAVALAAEFPTAALVLRSPFTSLSRMARAHYPYLPFASVLLKDRDASIGRIG